MSETNPPSDVDAVALQEQEQQPPRATSPTPSEISIRSDVSTASSRLPKPTGLRQPSATIKKPTTSPTTMAPPTSATRIGRICTAHGHGVKAGPPPLELSKSK